MRKVRQTTFHLIFFLGLFATGGGGALMAESLFLLPLSKGSSPEVRLLSAQPYQLYAEGGRVAWNDPANEVWVSLAYSDRVLVLDGKTGAVVRELPLVDNLWDIASTAGFVAGVLARDKSPQPVLVAADTRTGEILWRKDIKPTAIRFSPDGSRLLVRHYTKPQNVFLEVFDTRTGQSRSKAEVSSRSEGPIAFRDENHALLAKGEHRLPCIVELATGRDVAEGFEELREELPGDKSSISVDGRYLASIAENYVTGRGVACNIVEVPANGRPRVVTTFTTGEDEVLCAVEFSADGRRCAVFGTERTAVIDLPTGHVTGTIGDGGGHGALDQTGTQAAMVCDRTVRTARVSPGRNVPPLAPLPGNFLTLDLSVGGNLLAAAGMGGVFLWNTRTGQTAGVLDPKSRWPIVLLRFAPGGEALYFSDSLGLWRHPLPSAGKDAKRIFHWKTAKWTSSFFVDLDHEGWNILIARNTSAFLASLDKKSPDKLPIFRKIHPGDDRSSSYIDAARLWPDSKRIDLSLSGTAAVYSLSPDNLLNTIETATSPPSAFSPDGTQCLVRGQNFEIREIESGESLWSIPEPWLREMVGWGEFNQCALDNGSGLVAIAFSDSNKLVYGVAVLDTHNHGARGVFRTQRGEILKLVFGAGGRELFVLNSDSSIIAIPIPAPH